MKSIQTKRAAYSILVSQRAYVENSNKEGLIDDKEKNEFLGEID